MIEAKGLDKFDSRVKAWFAAVHKAAEDAAVGLAKQALKELVYESPQYSGDMAAQWRVGVNKVDTTFIENVIGGRRYFQGRLQPVFQRGSMDAITYATNNANTALAGFKLGSYITISNSAAHRLHITRYKGENIAFEGDGGLSHYASKIESGQINLRPVNSGASHILARASTYVWNRYATINSSQLAKLRVF